MDRISVCGEIRNILKILVLLSQVVLTAFWNSECFLCFVDILQMRLVFDSYIQFNSKVFQEVVMH